MNDTLRVVPQELSGDTKIGKHLYFKDIAFILMYFIGWSYLEFLIKPELISFFYILNLIIAVTLCIPSLYNPKRRLWCTVIFALGKDNKVYHNIKEQPVKCIKISDKELDELHNRLLYAKLRKEMNHI